MGAALDFLGGGDYGQEIDIPETTPCIKLDSKPEGEEELSILAKYFDSLQKGLNDMPVNEGVEDDEDDKNFIEEGRRLLVISRFHVLKKNVELSKIDKYNELFTTCWSEIVELSKTNEKDTGSLIVAPEFDASDLIRFVELNINEPMKWFGICQDFEVQSLLKGFPAVRIIYKLSDIAPVENDEV